MRRIGVGSHGHGVPEKGGQPPQMQKTAILHWERDWSPAANAQLECLHFPRNFSETHLRNAHFAQFCDYSGYQVHLLPMSQPLKANSSDDARCSMGVPGLDAVLNGGLPRNRL